MKRLFRFAVFILGFVLLSNTQIQATHLTGGELTYEWLNGDLYRLKLTLYRDCSGIAVTPSVNVYVNSASCGITNMTVLLNQSWMNTTVISLTCPGDSSTCDGGTSPGVERYEYYGTVTLPLNCTDYIFTYNDCCRNNAITNLSGTPGSISIQYRATMDKLNAPSNTSPEFGGNAILFLPNGTLQALYYDAYEPDGDSLAYLLVAALDSFGTPLLYTSTLDSLNPISSSTPVSLDPFTGILSVTPIGPEIDVVTIQINEYRNGILIGTVRHDIQIRVNGIINHQPVISGINGSSNYTIQTCAGDTVRFMLYSSDIDSGDATYFNNYPIAGLNVSISRFGSPQDSALIQIIPDASLINTSPFNLRFKVLDNKCPFQGSQDFGFQVYVNSCSDNIWPGDADSDLKCDLYDVFPIGLAYGANGPVRSGATNNWIAETATNWSQNFNSGVNFKHTDCNGDGIIDNLDTTAITLNYGLTHPVRRSEPNFIQAIGLLSLNADKDSVGPAENYSVKVKLGSNLYPVNDIYGIAFVLSFNPILTDSTQSYFNFLPSNLGTPTSDLLTYTKIDWLGGKIYGVAVRTDRVNSFSDGSIASFDVKTRNNIPVQTYSHVTLSGVRAISADGLAQALYTLNDSIYINTTSIGINELAEAFQIYIFPNPAQSELFIISDNNEKSAITIHDISGKIVMETKIQSMNSKIDISQLSNGIYSIQFNSDLGNIWKKMIVSR